MKYLKRFPPGAVVRGADLNALIDAIAETQIKCGPGLSVKRTACGTMLSIDSTPLDRKHSSRITGIAMFPAIILARLGAADNVVIGEPLTAENQWRYTWHQCDEQLAPIGADSIPIDGDYGSIPVEQVYATDYVGYGWAFERTDEWYRAETYTNGLPYRGDCYNLCEARNSAWGTQGNGVDIEALQTTSPNMAIQPVPNGTAVIVHIVNGPSGSAYWFSYENGIDGSCA